MTGGAPIIGVDLGRGGGPNADYLPRDPTDILLFGANEAHDVEEGVRGCYMDIFGLDPRLNVACSFSRRKSANSDTDFPSGNITVTIHAYTLSRSSGTVIEGPELPAADLFLNGGNLDDASKDDGCELANTAVQGVRFRFGAQRTDATSVDVIAQLQVRPNVALVCRELARALLEGVRVSLPVPGVF